MPRPLFGLKFLDTVGTDVLPFEINDVLGVITEDAGRLIFLQHDRGAVHVDFKGVFLCNVQSAAQFDGEDNASQLINLSHDAGRFHFNTSFPVAFPCIPVFI